MLGFGQRSGLIASTNFADKLIAIPWISASGTASLSRRADVDQ
jgi:hypothetical protein